MAVAAAAAAAAVKNAKDVVNEGPH